MDLRRSEVDHIIKRRTRNAIGSFALTTAALAGVMAFPLAISLAPAEAWSAVDDAMASWGGWLRSQPAQIREDDGRFLTAAIQRGRIEEVVTATGTLQPVDTVEVGSQLSGQISRLLVDFNDRVRLGTPLAEIDPRTFRAKVEEARAAVEMANADVRVTEAKLQRARIELDNARGTASVLQARLDNARAQATISERGYQRRQVLRSREVASAVAVEESEADVASRGAQLREAKAALDLNGFAVGAAAAEVRRLEAELGQVRAAVPLREASLRVAEIDLDRTTIRSPTDGVVVGRFVNQGQTLAAGLEARTAFNIARNLEEMEVHARLDETDIGRIKAGQPATFSVDAYPDRQFQALVRQVRKAPQVVQNVVTYTVVLKTDNQDGLLLPGMTALVRLTTHREDGVLKVPLAALRFRPSEPSSRPVGGPGPSIWLRTADGIVPIGVAVGASGSDQIAVRSDRLSEGDRVVVGEASAEPRRLFGFRVSL